MSSATQSTPSGNASINERPEIVRGLLTDIVSATATKPGYVVLGLLLSNYQLHLRVPTGEESLRARLGKRVAGVIRCEARRVDRVGTGGRYVEPVIGRPRRVQGTVLGVIAGENSLILNAGGAAGVDGLPLPVVVKLTDARQKADQFAIGSLVSMDVMDGATLTVA